MAKYIYIGTYSSAGVEGLISGDSDRAAAVKALADSVGAKVISVDITRGIYDFCVIIEAHSFEVAAAIALKVRASGAFDELITLEAVDINEVRKASKSVNYTPPQS